MKPIFCPSTYVSDSVANALTACFGQFIVYQPLAGETPQQMRPWVEKGILDIRTPVAGDAKELKAVVKNYLRWADLHFYDSGLKPPFLSHWKDAIPFFDATSSSQVVADIKEQVHGKPASGAPEPLLAARVFLYFAQEFDRQNEEVTQDLKRHHQQEAELLRQLKMEEDTSTTEFQKKEVQITNDSADYMALDRLEAWTQILLTDSVISGIFITHIPAILQELLKKTPSAEELLHFESIPICTAKTAGLAPWQQTLMSNLVYIVEQQWAATTGRLLDQPSFPDSEKTVSLRVYLVPDQMPRDFFSRCAQIQHSDRDTSYSGSRFINTLIGLIEFNNH